MVAGVALASNSVPWRVPPSDVEPVSDRRRPQLPRHATGMGQQQFRTFLIYSSR